MSDFAHRLTLDRIRDLVPENSTAGSRHDLTELIQFHEKNGAAVPKVDSSAPAGLETFGVRHRLRVVTDAADETRQEAEDRQPERRVDQREQLVPTDANPDPLENGKIRATWQHSKDSSIVWAQVLDGDASTDQNFVAEGAVAWLKLTRAGSQDGPTGGDTLTPTKFVQRVNTAGGVAPSTGCASPADVGRLAFMPYTADYIFYKLPEAPAGQGND